MTTRSMMRSPFLLLSHRCHGALRNIVVQTCRFEGYPPWMLGTISSAIRAADIFER